MEEIIQALRDQSENVPVPLDLPTDEDLGDVEEQILITLPREYREFLLTVSDVVYGNIEPTTAADRQSHTYLPDVAADAWNGGLPRHLIPICKDNHNFYFIDREGCVGLWTYKGFADKEWESIWEWASDIWLKNR